jgi:hypothetical protein
MGVSFECAEGSSFGPIDDLFKIPFPNAKSSPRGMLSVVG